MQYVPTRALCIAFAIASPAWSGWNPVHGSQNLFVETLWLRDGVLYVGTQFNGVFLLAPSSDSLVPSSLRSRVHCFAGEGPAIYAGTDSGVYRTDDKGLHWTHLPNPPNDMTIKSLSAQGDTLYAGTYSGLAATWDGGTSWSRVGGSLIQSRVEGVGVSGSRVFAGSGDDFTGYSFNRSDDGGKTWKSAGTGVAGWVTGVVFIGNRLFVASSGGLRISGDRGDTWSFTPDQAAVENSGDGFFASKLEFSGGTLFFSHYGGKGFASLDSGATWHRLKGYPMGTNSYAVMGGLLYAGSQDGLFSAPLDSGLAVRSWPRRRSAPAGSRLRLGAGGAEFWPAGSDRPSRADGRLLSGARQPLRE